MVSLIDIYFQQLPQDIQNLAETSVVRKIIADSGAYDFHTFANIISSRKPLSSNSNTFYNKSIIDFRIKRLVIKNFRKFGNKDEKPYIFEFVDKNDAPISVFCVGSNGSGKSSIYSALEYMIASDRVSCMAQRGINDIGKYLPYGSKSIDDMKLLIQLADSGISWFDTPLKNKFSLRPFFCNDWDIQELLSGKTLLSFFEENLGLEKLKELISTLRKSIAIFNHETSLEAYKNPETYNNDTLQQDYFYIGTLNSNKKINTLFQKIEEETNELSRIKNNTKEKLSKIDSYLRSISVMNELKKLSYYKSNENRIAQLRNYYDMLKEFDACSFLMENEVTDIDVMLEENIKYLTKLRSAFSWRIFSVEEHRRCAINAVRDSMEEEKNNKRNLLLTLNQNCVSVSQQNIDNLVKLSDGLMNIYKEKFTKIIESCKKVVEPVIQTFTELGDCQYEGETIEVVERNGELKVIIRNSNLFGANKEFTPTEFYNSFRFKLYCISVKISLAFMTMKTLGIKAPLVFDDVFTASDFDNTVNINRFFELLYSSYEKLGLGEAGRDLQIILFTHDEIVINSMSRMMRRMEYENTRFSAVTLIEPQAIVESDILETGVQNDIKAYRIFERI